MSGFVLAPESAVAQRWGEALCFVPAATRQALELGAWHGHAVGLDARFDATAAVDEHSGTQLALIGRIYPDADSWAQARSIPGRGGALCKLLLQVWKANPDRLAALLNGPAIALVWEPQAHCLHLFTDRMGIFPVYANSFGPLRVASHPDVLADWLASEGRPCPIDALSLADCLATGTTVQPYTFHQGIEQLEPASHYRYCGPGPRPTMQRSVTWLPPEPPPSPIADPRLAEEFAAALGDAGRRRHPQTTGSQGLLLSGGADSRALLFSAGVPSEVHTLTFCDVANAEAGVAKRLAQAAGATHHPLVRAPEHYGLGAAATVRITGGMGSIKDAHFFGFLPDLADLGLGNLMTGCYTDYLYKGLGFNRKARQFLGKNLPFDRLAPYQEQFYQPHCAIAPHWRKPLRQRHRERFPDTLTAAYSGHPEAAEDLRIRPLSREADALGRLFLLRTLPWDPVMTDFSLLPLYRRMSPEQKLNARVFRQAVFRLLPAAARGIPNNNDGAPLDASEFSRCLRYLALTGIRKFARLGGWRPKQRLATEGSWPDFGYYLAHSKVLPELWTAPSPGQRELLSDLMGRDPWRTSLPEWAKEGSDQILRLITLRIWLEQRAL